MKYQTINTKISYTMHSTDPHLGYIGVGIEHLPCSWWKSYQVLLLILLIQFIEGNDIEYHPQEPSSYQFKVCKVPEKISHLPLWQTPSNVESHLTKTFSHNYQWRHGSILCLLFTRQWNRPPVAPLQHLLLNIESVVLWCHLLNCCFR